MNVLKRRVFGFFIIVVILCSLVYVFLGSKLTFNWFVANLSRQFPRYNGLQLVKEIYVNKTSSALPKQELLVNKLISMVVKKNISSVPLKRTTRGEQQNNTVFVIPPKPEVSSDDTVQLLPQVVMDKYLNIPYHTHHEEIIILTPIHNVADRLDHYAFLLKQLSYPHHLISIALGEDCSTDDTLAIAKSIVKDLHKEFRRAELYHFNSTGQVAGGWVEVHDRGMQYKRRKHLAHSRNLLLKSALQNETWVVWIDSDISSLPFDLVQQLLSAEADVVAPCCLFKDRMNVRVYDKNTWRETEESLNIQKTMPSSQLMLEGYGPSSRIYLPHLRSEGRVVPIDGVGGCSLLVRADCHRKGLIFPEDIYDHHIETEGLAKMAQKMGFGVYGMPFLEVFH